MSDQSHDEVETTSRELHLAMLRYNRATGQAAPVVPDLTGQSINATKGQPLEEALKSASAGHASSNSVPRTSHFPPLRRPEGSPASVKVSGAELLHAPASQSQRVDPAKSSSKGKEKVQDESEDSGDSATKGPSNGNPPSAGRNTRDQGGEDPEVQTQFESMKKRNPTWAQVTEQNARKVDPFARFTNIPPVEYLDLKEVESILDDMITHTLPVDNYLEIREDDIVEWILTFS
ncbi:hypothetical protein R1sor_000961 [Riccia sorocarpa]|uniref:Uncharacterized protein n=1 Tax=Riccia sorocarpa TaxID=122646 RepID=A0ABD3H0M7_9MARC